MATQCRLSGIARPTVYAGKAAVVDEAELLLLRLLDEEYTRHPFKNGLQVVVVWLRAQGHIVNRKRVQRLIPAGHKCGYWVWPRWPQDPIPAKSIHRIPIGYPVYSEG